MMKGWISYHKDDKQQLIDLGVKLSGKPIQDEHEGFIDNCTVSEEVFSKLDPLWGCFIWGLILFGD